MLEEPATGNGTRPGSEGGQYSAISAAKQEPCGCTEYVEYGNRNNEFRPVCSQAGPNQMSFQHRMQEIKRQKENVKMSEHLRTLSFHDLGKFAMMLQLAS